MPMRPGVRQCPGIVPSTGLRCRRSNPNDDSPLDWTCPAHAPGVVPKQKPRPKWEGNPDEVIRSNGGMTRAEHAESLLFGPGHHFAGQAKEIAIRDNLEWFLSTAATIAVDMELGTWVDPESGVLWEGGRFSRRRIGEVMGFPAASKRLPSFMEEPRFSRSVQWERVRREADMRMSSQTVKPMVSVLTSGMMTELLNRVLNHPEKISDRELIAETRRYVEMMVSWDEGTREKPHIQQTLTLLIQNINGLPPSSRLKVRSMLGREMQRGMDAIKQIAGTIGEEVSA